MSEFQVAEFNFKGKIYKFKQPLTLTIERNCAFNDELGISVVIYKQMPGQLKRDANGQICMLWEGYALCPDEKLSISGLELKHKLLSMVVG